MRNMDLFQQVQMGAWHLHMAPEVDEASPSSRAPQASGPPSHSRVPLAGHHICREGTAAAPQPPCSSRDNTNNVHSNNSLGNQPLLPAGAGPEEPKRESRTSQLHISPILVGDQTPRTEYSSKEEAFLKCSSSYFIRVAQNQ